MRMSGSPYWTGGGASGNPTHALFADRSHSFPDNVVALLGYIRAWNCSAEPARSAVGEYSSIRLKDWSDAAVLPLLVDVPCPRDSPGADQPLDVGLHQQLQHRLRHGSQKISLAGLLQQFGQHQSLFGHRVLSCFRL